MKVCIYTRVSTKDKGQDADNQDRQLKEYCKRLGYEIVKEYSDTVSGGKGRESRPNFKQMLEDARLKHFDAVVVWALDRFTREGVRKCLEYMKKLDSYGVKFISHQEEYFNTLGPWKDAIMAIMATLAEQERFRISERVKAGLEKTKAKGTKLGAPKKRKRKNHDKILELKADGESVRGIADRLSIGISTVQRVLKSA